MDPGAMLAQAGAFWVGAGSARMPKRLGELPDPPWSLVGQGAEQALLTPHEAPVIAIVGSRRPTARGIAFARSIARDLAHGGATIVSGLALGIDAAAHRGTLDADGVTIAVLGSSIDHVAPKANADLAQRIRSSGGVVVSEYWLGTPPAPWRYPARNRIVAGLADAVVVVEAAERSGALITADFALDLGRPVLAVPGPAGATASAGCHALIRAGAALCESADDVIAEVAHRRWRLDPGDDAPALTGSAARIHTHLSRGAASVDELADELGIPAEHLLPALGRLEIDGYVTRIDHVRYGTTGRGR